MIDAANEFVAVAIYNNVEGKDAEVLKRFKEPAWNNPVVRFLKDDEKDVIARKDGVYGTPELLSRMMESLKKAGRPVPEYLKLATFEANPSAREKAVFAMYCYWEGERLLGELDGVLATRIGMLSGAEVVEVEFDPTVVTFVKLLEKANTLQCATQVFTRNELQQAKAKAVVGNRAVRSDTAIDVNTQQQYHLSLKPSYYLLPLTPLQATKVNAALGAGTSPDKFLTPGQIGLQKRIAAEPKRFSNVEPDRSEKGLPVYATKVGELATR